MVVMTKEIGYRRKPSSMLTLTKLRYKKYPSDVGRIEKNKEKLTALYEQGYRDALDCYEELIRYLED